MFSQLKLPARRSMRTVTLTLMTWVMSTFFATTQADARRANAKSFSLRLALFFHKTSKIFARVVAAITIRVAIIAAGFVLLLSEGVTTSVKAEPKLRSAEFWGSPQNASTVNVGAEGGKWLVMKSKGITYKFNYYVKANRSLREIRVSNAGVTRTWGRQNFLKEAGQVKLTAWGDGSFFVQNGFLGADRDVVMKACNDLLLQGKTTAERQETFANLPLVASVRIGKGKNRTTFSRLNGFTMVKVICELEPSMIQAPPEPYSVDLRVTQQGASCPKRVEVRAFIKYRQPATARFRFKVNGKLSELVEIRARKLRPQQGVPGDTYLVERVKYYDLDPGQTNFRIEVRDGKKSDVKTVRITCPPMKVNRVALDYTQIADAICPKQVWETSKYYTTRPGKVRYEIKQQSGLVAAKGEAKATRRGNEYFAVVQRLLKLSAVDYYMVARGTKKDDASSGLVKLKVECINVLSSKLDILKLDGQSCPTKAFVRATYETSKAGGFRDFLRCSDGSEKTGVINARKLAGKFIATRTMSVDIRKTTTLKCSARAQDFKAKSIVFAKKFFRCEKPGASGDIAVQPDPVEPPRPAVRLTGNFQFVDRARRKICPRKIKAVINFVQSSSKSVRYALACNTGTFRGQALAKRSRGRYVAPASVSFRLPRGTNGKVRVNCALKSITASGSKILAVKGRVFQCIRPTFKPGASGLTTPGRRPQAANRIRCRGGKVRGKRCICKAGKKSQKVGKRAFVCVKKPTRIKKQTRIKKPTRIKCIGGKVRKGQCRCRRKKVLVNGRCIKPAS